MSPREALAELIASAETGNVIFPTTAELALKVQRALDDPDCSVDQLARLVQTEPLLASKLVAMANSVIYNRNGEPVANIKAAVSRLGLKTLRVVAASVVVRQMEGMAKAPRHRALARQLWERTAHVAVLAQLIARRVTHQDPDTAFFAGIVHDIGGFYLIAHGGAFPGLLEGGDGSLTAWAEGSAARLGRTVLQRLGIPPAAMTAIEGLWDGYLAIPPASLSDTLLLAAQLAPVESPLTRLAGEGRDGTRIQIDLVLDQETLSGILAASEQEVASLIGALNA